MKPRPTRKKPYGPEDCIELAPSTVPHGKVIVYSIDNLHKEFERPHYQLHYVDHGTTLDHYNSVWAYSLYDGEYLRIHLEDMVGIMDPDKLPAYAKAMLEAHVDPGLVKKLDVEQSQQLEMDPFTEADCMEKNVDWVDRCRIPAGHVVVYNMDSLPEGSRKRICQLFYIDYCVRQSDDNKIYAVSLCNGKRSWIELSQMLGIIEPAKLPREARKRLAMHCDPCLWHQRKSEEPVLYTVTCLNLDRSQVCRPIGLASKRDVIGYLRQQMPYQEDIEIYTHVEDIARYCGKHRLEDI